MKWIVLQRFLGEVRVGCGRWISKALIEFSINIIVSMLPFLVAIGTLMIVGKTDLDFSSAMTKVTSKGELIVYSATLMAPIIYAVVKDPPIYFRPAFILFSILIIVAGVAVYVLTTIDESFSGRLVVASQICFASSVSVYMMLLLAQHALDHRKSAPKVSDDNKQSSLEGYKRHRGIN